MPTAAGPGPRVLCVDDNRDAADTTALVLRLRGYVTCACYSGAAALVEAIEFRPGVCLLDLHMPGMDGDELAGRLRAWAAGRRPPLVLVAVTAMSDAAGRSRVAAAGFDGHLVKPVDPAELARLVGDLTAPPGGDDMATKDAGRCPGRGCAGTATSRGWRADGYPGTVYPGGPPLAPGAADPGGVYEYLCPVCGAAWGESRAVTAAAPGR